jgi:dTDP-4-dehydrorhamnose reductase
LTEFISLSSYDLERTFEQDGMITASTRWLQACSFVDDTVDGLYRLSGQEQGGIFHLDSNPGLNFYEIVHGLNRRHGQRWHVQPGTEPQLDNRLRDDRIQLRSLVERFQA